MKRIRRYGRWNWMLPEWAVYTLIIALVASFALNVYLWTSDTYNDNSNIHQLRDDKVDHLKELIKESETGKIKERHDEKYNRIWNHFDSSYRNARGDSAKRKHERDNIRFIKDFKRRP